MSEFKFKLGDVVRHFGEAALNDKRKEALLFIVEQHLVRSQQATQRWYGCRSISVAPLGSGASYSTGFVSFMEEELVEA